MALLSITEGLTGEVPQVSSHLEEALDEESRPSSRITENKASTSKGKQREEPTTSQQMHEAVLLTRQMETEIAERRRLIESLAAHLPPEDRNSLPLIPGSPTSAGKWQALQEELGHHQFPAKVEQSSTHSPEASSTASAVYVPVFPSIAPPSTALEAPSRENTVNHSQTSESLTHPSYGPMVRYAPPNAVPPGFVYSSSYPPFASIAPASQLTNSQMGSLLVGQTNSFPINATGGGGPPSSSHLSSTPSSIPTNCLEV